MENKQEDFKACDIQKGVKFETEKGIYIISGDQPLGAGAYGTVFEACKVQAKQVVALKAVSKDKDVFIESFRREKDNMIKIKDKHVVQILDEWEFPSTAFLVLEFCNEGTLEKYMEENIEISEQSALKIIRQILKGLQALQKKNISHRDLKPANILSHNGIIKIADLGHSKEVKDSEGLVTFVGTPWYMAPEVLKLKGEEFYSEKCDIYGTGMILYEMFFRRFPFDKNIAKTANQFKLNKAVQANQIDFEHPTKKISLKMEQLLRKMLEIDPEKRISFNELLNHELIKEGHKNFNQKGLEDIVNMEEGGQSQEEDVDEEKKEEVDEYHVNNITKILEDFTDVQTRRKNAMTVIKDILNEINIFNQIGIAITQMSDFKDFYITREYAHFYLLKKLAHEYTKLLDKMENKPEELAGKLLLDKLQKHAYFQRLKKLIKDILENIVEGQLGDSGMQLEFGVDGVEYDDVTEIQNNHTYTEQTEVRFKDHLTKYFKKLKEDELYRQKDNKDRVEAVQKHMLTVLTILDSEFYFRKEKLFKFDQFKVKFEEWTFEEREEEIQSIVQHLGIQ